MSKRRYFFLIATFALFLSACQIPAVETPTAAPSPTAAPTRTPLPTLLPSPTATPNLTPTVVPTPAVIGKPWWNDAVFYEIFVRSFYDSDGDGVGDLNGIIEKLDYLNDGDPATTDDLGITGIWLMPITASPSYHGYDVTDYYTVDPDYGANQDFQRLVTEAHKRGIRVIVDLVMNHTSTQHPWFQAAKAGDAFYRDWYLWAQEDPGYRGPWNETVWHKTPGGYYYAVFWGGMPDLNLRNPAVTAELYQINRFWLEEMGVDGFRLDAIRHFVEDGRAQENTPETHAWLQEYYKFYKGVNPDAFTVGEAWTITAEVLKYTGNEVDIAFAFDLAEAFLDAAAGPLNVPVVKEMSNMVENFSPGQYATFLTNHDQNRVMSQLRDVGQAKLAAVMLLTSPGVPFIYYGEEIGMTGAKPDEDIRRPMQWHAENVGAGFTTGLPWRLPALDYKTVNVLVEEDDPDSLLNHYRALIHLRNAHAALRTGEWRLVDTGSARLFAYLRATQEEAILVIVNMHPQDMPAGNYALTLETGPLSGPVMARTLLGLENPASPEINPGGGFSDYVPFDLIPGGSFAIIHLGR